MASGFLVQNTATAQKVPHRLGVTKGERGLGISSAVAEVVMCFESMECIKHVRPILVEEGSERRSNG